MAFAFNDDWRIFYHRLLQSLYEQPPEQHAIKIESMHNIVSN